MIHNLAYMFTTGQGGLNKDEAKAVKLYAIAAEQGYVASQHNLGALYEQGVGGPPELKPRRSHGTARPPRRITAIA
ncbi:hypothetical protein LP419_20365 [Massilia sp. H-1]|nr:hypothetical protein LP419_20365 [Massilia sp. H-1]